MRIDTAIAVAAIVLAIVWPTHQQLTIRALRHSLRRQRDQLAQHRRAIVQLQGAAIHPPTSIGRPVQGGWVDAQPRAREAGPELFIPYHGASAAQVGPGRSSHRRAAPRDERVVSGDRPGSGEPTPPPDTDATLRLARPPALSDLQHVLTHAGRALTATEIATQLGRKPWDLIADIDRDMAAGLIRTVPGHTAGRTAYTLADPTERMPHGMPVLPGAVSR